LKFASYLIICNSSIDTTWLNYSSGFLCHWFRALFERPHV
jgi:hypothetical protein